MRLVLTGLKKHQQFTPAQPRVGRLGSEKNGDGIKIFIYLKMRSSQHKGRVSTSCDKKHLTILLFWHFVVLSAHLCGFCLGNSSFLGSCMKKAWLDHVSGVPMEPLLGIGYHFFDIQFHKLLSGVPGCLLCMNVTFNGDTHRCQLKEE